MLQNQSVQLAGKNICITMMLYLQRSQDTRLIGNIKGPIIKATTLDKVQLS